jgi:hypothetical protein
MLYTSSGTQLKPYVLTDGCKHQGRDSQIKRLTFNDEVFLHSLSFLNKKGYSVLVADSGIFGQYGPYIEFNVPRDNQILPALPDGFLIHPSHNFRIYKPIHESNRQNWDLKIEDIVIELFRWAEEIPSKSEVLRAISNSTGHERSKVL